VVRPDARAAFDRMPAELEDAPFAFERVRTLLYRGARLALWL
jgi:hypothetical protein